jgi:hypothetical protein
MSIFPTKVLLATDGSKEAEQTPTRAGSGHRSDSHGDPGESGGFR